MKKLLGSIVRAGLVLALTLLASAMMSSRATAQGEDTWLHFTVVVSASVQCSVTIGYYPISGGGVDGIFGPGTTARGGGGPFTIYDAGGGIHAINAHVHCLYSLSIGPNCCVDVCYSTDPGNGMPVITVTPAANPTCPDS